MLLRYVALHGPPLSDDDWAKYLDWKAKQLALSECMMAETEAEPTGDCATCAGRPDCPKAARRKT